MTANDILAYCLAKKAAYEDHPFGPSPTCAKVGGRIFAQILSDSETLRVTLKCEPVLAQILRAQYPDIVSRGYHCPTTQQPHWNTIRTDQIEDSVLLEMIDHSYERAVNSLTKKARAELLL